MHIVSFFQRDKIKKKKKSKALIFSLYGDLNAGKYDTIKSIYQHLLILCWIKTKYHMQYQLKLLNSGRIINSKCSEMVKSCELVPVLTVAEEREKRTSGNIRQTSFLPSCKDVLHIQVNEMLSKRDTTLTFCSCF